MILFIVLYGYEAFNIEQNTSLSGHGFLFRAISFAMVVFLSHLVLGSLHLKFLKMASSIYLLVVLPLFTVLGLWGLFNFFWNNTEWNVYAGFLMLTEYASVYFPTFVFYALFQKQEINTTSKASSSETNSSQLLDFPSKNKSESFQLRSDDWLYAKSEGNYVEIGFLSSKSVKTILIRTSLKEVEAYLSEAFKFIRCHRSYLINPAMIVRMHQKSRTFIVELKGSCQIPVSNSYQKDVQSYHKGSIHHK